MYKLCVKRMFKQLAGVVRCHRNDSRRDLLLLLLCILPPFITSKTVRTIEMKQFQNSFKTVETVMRLFCFSFISIVRTV